MPDLSNYTNQMLGTANATTEPEEKTNEGDVRARTKQGKERARGVPIVGPGSLGGRINGTDPLEYVLALEEEGRLWGFNQEAH